MNGLIVAPGALVPWIYQQSPEYLLALGAALGFVTAICVLAAVSSAGASPRRPQAPRHDTAAPLTRIGRRRADEREWLNLESVEHERARRERR